MAGGELFTHLYQREHFTEDEVRIYIAEIILALEQLHKVRGFCFLEYLKVPFQSECVWRPAERLMSFLWKLIQV